MGRKGKIMKYVIVDERDNGQGFYEEYDSREKAIQEADKEWNRYTTAEEKRHTTAFYILESVNPDEDAPNHFDGNDVKRYK